MKLNQFFLTIFNVEKGSIPGLGLYIFKHLLTSLKPIFIGSIGLKNNLIKYHEFLGFKVFKMDHYFILSKKISNFKICKSKKINLKKKKIDINQYSISSLNIKNINSTSKNIFEFQSPLKSRTYIKKRYIENPFFDYLIYKIEKKKYICSILVIRKIQHKGSIILKLIDYFGSDKYIPISSYYCQLLININKAEYIDFYSHGIAKTFFQKSLFINRYDQKNIIIPEYFEPFLKKNIDLVCAYKTNMKNKTRLFKGDGDQDRPSILR